MGNVLMTNFYPTIEMETSAILRHIHGYSPSFPENLGTGVKKHFRQCNYQSKMENSIRF